MPDGLNVQRESSVDYSAIYTLPFTFQLCYKPLGILQGITKSHKVHLTSDDGFPNFITSTLIKIVAGIRTSFTKC